MSVSHLLFEDILLLKAWLNSRDDGVVKDNDIGSPSSKTEGAFAVRSLHNSSRRGHDAISKTIWNTRTITDNEGT
jgi:hypothetical protein